MFKTRVANMKAERDAFADELSKFIKDYRSKHIPKDNTAIIDQCAAIAVALLLEAAGIHYIGHKQAFTDDCVDKKLPHDHEYILKLGRQAAHYHFMTIANRAYDRAVTSKEMDNFLATFINVVLGIEPEKAKPH